MNTLIEETEAIIYRGAARRIAPAVLKRRRSYGVGLWLLALFLVLAQFCRMNSAVAAFPTTNSSSTQFDITGFIEEATLDGAIPKAGAAHQGGHIKLNGHVVTVPAETIVILPANALTWQELFALAPSPYGGTQTGLALHDSPAPMSTYEAHVVGNRVIDGKGGDQYIAGLIYISQQDLNSGAGFINYIDYTLGEMRVGGNIGSSTTGTRVRINDPVGRFGRVVSPDPRFTVDADNPTIASATGFPMCLPRTDPTVADDPLCPQGNRNGQPDIIQMNDPIALPGVFPDATKQAPFEVGDYVTYAGTLVNDTASPTAGPWPGIDSTYISAHTISNNVAIYTWPGRNPAYVSTEVTIIGTGGLTVIGAGEAAIRTRFEGMTTDPSRNIHLYGIDLDPFTGASTDRDWGTIGVDQGPPTGAVKGRWRFRPPCTASVATDKACTPPPAGTFLPPTREVRAVIEGAWVPGQTTSYANGLIAGQYHAPILEYIFPENIPGSPIAENNFNTIDFLAKGGYASSTGIVASQLKPWPSDVIPNGACGALVASAGGPYATLSTSTVTLAAAANGTTPTFAWDPLPADGSQGTLSSLTIAKPVYTPPTTVPATGLSVGLSLTVTDKCGNAVSSSTSVTVNAPGLPTVSPVAPISVFSGASFKVQISGTSPSGKQLTFTAKQSGTPALSNLATKTTGSSTGELSFNAPTLASGTVVASVITLTITATDGTTTSQPITTTVTINPLPDAVAITTAQYRTSKQRLDITATSSVVSPNVQLKLQPYVTEQGDTFDPSTLGNTLTNNGGGLYAITLVGAPPPACKQGGAYAIPCSKRPLIVKSNLNGASPATALSNIRQ